MISANAAAADVPLFSVVLAPHRSLSPRGLLVVMAVLASLSFTVGTVFWAIGAWPV